MNLISMHAFTVPKIKLDNLYHDVMLVLPRTRGEAVTHSTGLRDFHDTDRRSEHALHFNVQFFVSNDNNDID